jgi:hypothetical protein
VLSSPKNSRGQTISQPVAFAKGVLQMSTEISRPGRCSLRTHSLSVAYALGIRHTVYPAQEALLLVFNSFWEGGEWQTRTAECRRGSANPLPRKQMGGRLGVAGPLFVPLTTRGADPRSESYRYGWSLGTPQATPSTLAGHTH